MTKYDRNLFNRPVSDPSTHANAGHGIDGLLLHLFHASLEAHDFAVLSNKRVSFADLYESGTWQKYEQRASALARKHPSRDPLIAYLANDRHGSWTGANSRQSYRSALVRLAARDVLELAPRFWRLVIAEADGDVARRQLILELKPHVDEETRDRIGRAVEVPSPTDIQKLKRAVEFLIQVPPDPDHTAVRSRATVPDRQDPKARTTSSKKDTLYALNRHQRRKSNTNPGYNWRDRFWNAAVIPDPHLEDDRRACIAALMLTGCRPSELSDDLGVRVSALERAGQPYLAFEIAGAKLAEETGERHGKGQERRNIELRCQTPEAEWLFAYATGQDSGQCFLGMPAPAYSQNGIPLMPTERRRRVTGSLGKLIGRLGKVAFPRLQQRLTPYVFRHALSSDLRTRGGIWDKEDIAAALGHRSTRTQKHYGSANTSRGLIGSRAEQIAWISGVAPVRSPDRGSHPAGLKPQSPKV
ncbi:hypothetical protein [Roseovarius pacificus]|uniref:hypothetical protein n=1 Tax=Roseovarius pacificus TaxID=337701 RepID=UPI004038FE2A